jgi:hypothetical protein
MTLSVKESRFNIHDDRLWHPCFVLTCLQMLVPGPPFVAGGLMVIAAMLVALFMPAVGRRTTDIVLDPLLIEDLSQDSDRRLASAHMIGVYLS